MAQFGKNVRLSRQDIELAIRIYAHNIGKSRGTIPLYSDVHDFIERTNMHWNFAPAASQKEGEPALQVSEVYVTIDE